MVEIVVPLAFFSLVFGIVYIIVSARNKERMKLIEKGVDASIFHNQKKSSNNVLKWAMLSIGAGVGILMGHVAETNFGLEDDIAFPSMIFLFAGIFWVGFYFIDRAQNKNESETDRKE